MPTISKIGFCKYKGTLPIDNEGNTIFPIDINEGRGVQFSFNYSWSGDNCTITNIRWRPARIVLNEETNEREVEYGFGLGRTKTEPAAENPVQNYFTTANHLTIQFHNVTLNLPNNQNRISTPTGYNFGDLSNPITTTQKYILANFIYSYKPNGEDEESENFVEYFVKIENIKIPKTSKYEHNVVFTENGVNELLTKIKKYPVTSIEGTAPTGQQPYITVHHGSDSNAAGTKIKVGSVITFPASQNKDSTGTFRVSIDGTESIVPIKGFGSGSSGDITLGGDLLPSQHNKYDIGQAYTKATEYQENTTYYIIENGYYKESDTQPNSNHDFSTEPYYYVSGPRWKSLYLTGNIGSPAVPVNYIYAKNIGESNFPLNSIYGVNGNFTNLITTDLTTTNLTVNGKDITSLVPSSKGTTAQFWRGGGDGNPDWSNELTGTLILSNPQDADVGSDRGVALIVGSRTSQHLEIDGNEILSKTSASTIGDLYLNHNCKINDQGYLTAIRVYNAVFNDYAEYRTTINLTPGHVVIDQDDGSLASSTARLQPGAQVISDTFGHSMGETDTAKTPLAVAGRVLVYTYQPRENYHAGMAVCSAPDGTVDIMTREEIRDYPDCIIGIVSEIPQYETWGSDNVKVDGRIWIKVK